MPSSNRKTIAELPLAPPEAVADGTFMITDSLGNDYRVPTSVLGGARIVFTHQDNQTTYVFGRLISPGRTVENITATLVATPVGGGTAVTKTTLTNNKGEFSYDYSGVLARGVSYNIQVSVSAYLTETMVKTIAALSAPVNTLIATSTGKVGDTITQNVTLADFDGSPISLEFRYLRGATYVIPGANAISYTLQADDDADIIKPQVRVVNAGGTSGWFDTTPIGPVSNKTSALLTNPVITGANTLGGRFTISNPGSASNNAIVKSDEWQLDQASIPSNKAPVIRYMAGAANVSASASYPDGSNHHGFGLGGNMYTGSNTFSYSVAPSATENDYFVILVGSSGGNEGAQKYDMTVRHLNTNSAIRIQMFASKYRGGVLQEEVQMSKVGVTAGTELNELAVTMNAQSSWTLTHDFGEWIDGDFLVIRQKARNSSSSSANSYQWDSRSGVTFASLPLGPANDIQKSLSAFTSRNDMAGKKLRLKRTYSNRNNDVIGYSNEITLEASTTQTLAPVNTVLPSISAKSDRSNSKWYVDLGAWSHQPTQFQAQWTLDGVDIAGATTFVYTTLSAQEGHVIACRVTASNGIGSASAVTADKTVRQAAVYYNLPTGNDANDGLTADSPKQTTTGSAYIPVGATAIIQASTNQALDVGASRSYTGEGVGADIPIIGVKTGPYGIDSYTDGLQGRSNINLTNLRIIAGYRGIQQRQGNNWTLDGVIFEDIGFNPGSLPAENTQGYYIYNANNQIIRNCNFALVRGDALYLDTCNYIIVEDTKFAPVFTAEGDNVQTRADRTAARQRGLVFRRNYLDMYSVKTSSGKGNLVSNMQDYVCVLDCTFMGNNFSRATDEGDNHVFARNDCSHARKNTYSSAYSIGGYDNQPASHNHISYDNRYFDYNRAISWTGISVTGYTGIRSGRVDVKCYDETIVKCSVGMRVDRPTSGEFMGFVFHNVTKPLDRINTEVPPDATMGFTWGPHYTYNGSIVDPPKPTTRATISGTRTVGSVLSGPDSVFDTAAVLAAFPGAVITHTYQWRRHKPMPKIYNWNQHLSWSCEYIDGATASSYTIQDADQGCRISRVDRIHLAFTEGGVAKIVTAVSYDSTYPTSTEITRTGDLATPLSVISTTGALLSATNTAVGAVILDLPPLLTGETRTLLHPNRAYDPYTGSTFALDSNGDLVKGSGVVTAGTGYSVTIRQKRGIDILDSRITITAVS